MKNCTTSSVSKRNRFSLKFIGLILLFLVVNVSEGWGQIISESFNEATTNSATGGTGMPNNGYATGAYVLNSGTWSFTAAIRGTANVNSSPGCQIQSGTGNNIITPTITTGGVGVITFYAAGTSANAAVNVSISINGGAFSAGTSFTSLTTTSTQKQLTINDASANIRVKFTRTAGTLTLDDIVITSAEPTTQTTAITFSSVSTTSMTVNWTSGNGGRRAVFMKAGSGAITNPTDGVAYSASGDWNSKGTQLGTSGYYCIYNGTGTTVSLTNLVASTTYYIQSFEYNSDNNTTPTATTINYNTNTATGNPNSQATTSAGSPPPTLTADATSNTVDNNIDITFPEDAIWRGLVSAVKVGGTALTATTDYVLSDGNLQLKPSGGNTLLRAAGSKTVTIEATGYTTATIIQAINAGAANKLAMGTQPTAPASNGAVLATQPTVYIQDQYGNATTSTANITATVGAGAWTLGGTNIKAGVAGTATYTDLTATAATAVTGATISFAGDGLTGTTSAGFNIPAPAPTITVSTMDGFGSITVNTTSGELSYTVSAEHLTENLVVTPPVGFEISTTSGSGFVTNPSTLTLTQTGGTINTTTVYVRFNPALVQAYSATITHTSNAATTKNVAVSGTATAAAAPTTSTATDITNSSFTANWGAVSGASGYKLDVATNNTFISAIYTNIVSWDFPNNPDDATSDGGIIANNSKTLSTTATGGISTYAVMTVPAATSSVASASTSGAWASGNGSKYWEIEFITVGHYNIRLSSLQRSSNTGPRDFKVQYKIGAGGTYTDVANGSITIANDWITGQLTNVTLPASCDNQSSVYLRWIMTSNIGVNGSTVANTGTSAIDNISIEGNSGDFVSGYQDIIAAPFQSVTGLTANTTYYYRVRSTGGGATSANSNTTTVLTAPSAPTAAEETNNTATGFTAIWALPTGGATSYALDVSENIGFSSFVSGYENLAVTGTSQVVSGLSPNTTYYYRVKAINATATATSGTITAATNNSIAVAGTINVSTLPVCSTCDVVVAAGATLTVNENRTFNALTVNPTGKLTNTASTLTLATLNLNSDATGTGTFVDNGTSIITAAHVQQYLTTGRNWYVSIPVTAADTTALSTSNAVKYWDEPTGLWKSPTVLALDIRKGYISAGTKSTGVITFDGELNNGNVTFNATRTEGVYKEGFNLIGNPYPSYVNWESATKTRVGTSIWYRTKNSGGTYVFDTFNGVGTNNNQGGAVTGMIPPMQAVWVRVDVAQTTGSVLFTNAMRAHESGTNKLKAPAVNNPLQILRLQVSNAENSDEAIIVFNDNASNALDTYDSPKMTNSNNAIPEIYSLIGSDELVINGMNSYSSTTEIPVGFRTGATNNFSIKATEVSNFEDGTQIILKDSELTTETDITNGTPYTFASDAVSTPNRFSIIFRNSSITTGLDHNQSNDKSISVYRNSNSHIVVNCSSDIVGNGNVSVYNAIGQKLTYKAINSTSTVLEQSYTAGVYFVSVVANGKTITRKVIVD